MSKNCIKCVKNGRTASDGLCDSCRIQKSNETCADLIGGFPQNSPQCNGCGELLIVDNAWMHDGCPCNSPLGINAMNEHRWRLLVELQQQQSRDLEPLRNFKAYVHRRLDEAGVPADPDSPHKAEGCRIGGRLDIVLSYRFAPTPGDKFASGFGVGGSIKGAIAEQYNTKTAKARAVLRTIGTKGYPSVTVGELSEALAELEVQS